MRRSLLIAMAMITLVGLSTSAFADDKVDSAIKELDGKFAKLKSYAAHTEAMTDAEFGPGFTHKSEMTGQSEWMRKGEKILMRAETKMKTTQTQDGNAKTTASKMLTIDDGAFLYALTEEAGSKRVMKSASMGAKMYSPSGYFQMLKSSHDIKLLADADVNGDACYVFEAKMKPTEGLAPGGRQVIYFHKDHGILVKSETFDAKGKLTGSSIAKDIKINPSLSADRFVFKVPEGAQVIDTTKTQGGSMAPAPAAEEKPKPEAEEKKEGKKKKKGITLPGGIKL